MQAEGDRAEHGCAGDWDRAAGGRIIAASMNTPRQELATGMIITIDGPAGSGKSTAARKLAARLGIAFLDTGAMYRVITLLALEEGIDLGDEGALAAAAAEAARRRPAPVPAGAMAFALGSGPAQPEIDPADPQTWGKTGRNTPCPCGSGKKYKHCHGRLR